MTSHAGRHTHRLIGPVFLSFLAIKLCYIFNPNCNQLLTDIKVADAAMAVNAIQPFHAV